MSLDIKVAWVSVILKELGVPVRVASKGDRIAMQKAVYLAQISGRDLGYRFSWYVNGPYSAKLADAYYQADEERAVYEHYVADDATIHALQSAKNLIAARPPGVDLANWLEAVGSLDFMARVMSRPMSDSINRCQSLKPHLAPLFEYAKKALVEYGFQLDGA